MEIEGTGIVDLHLRRDKFMHTPSMNRNNGEYTLDTAETETAFYTDINRHGSFACTLSADVNGIPSCKLSALVNMQNEFCYISPGAQEADCSTLEDKFEHYSDLVDRERETSNIPLTNETVSGRSKRSIYPDVGFYVIELGFIVDKKFMSLFYDRNPGNTFEAEEEANLYITLFTNELNVYFSTLKEASSGQLDIYLYPKALIYPEAGHNYSWIEQFIEVDKLSAYGGFDYELISFLETIDNGTNPRWDQVLFMTGYRVFRRDYKFGYHARSRAICNTTTRWDSYIVLGHYPTNIPYKAAQMIGKNFGMRYEWENGYYGCPLNSTYIMYDVYSNVINMSNPDTYYKFSTCSAASAISHLDSQQDCLNTHGFTDMQFREKFCSGLPGAQDGWLVLQCQKETNWNYSTPCSLPSSAADCYTPYSISCYNETGECIPLFMVWQGTPCGADKICYQSDCVNSFEVCDQTTTTTTPTTTTTTPTTTTPTTTTPTTTTTTTPTTTTTTPTTTTTTPTTTTTTPTTTTPTTTTPTTTTTTTTTPTTTTPTTTTTTPTKTTTTPTTTTPDLVPCDCCGIVFKKRRKTCCRRGRKRFNRRACYCCSELFHVSPPFGWTGPSRL